MYEGSASETILQQVQILFNAGTAVGLTDRDLLERYLHHGRESGETAFTALVERHGPMVFRVCKQALRDRHAAEDAFQATFLVLARRAWSIRKHDSVASWLFGVACRAAARIRMMEARRQRYERRGASVRAHRDINMTDSSESWPELHAEIARLPEKYRVAVVLCYFEGLTHEQAAGRLGWPVGTVKTRLARAREQLRWHLERRGWKTVPLLLTENLRPHDVLEIPRRLLDSTAKAAARFVSDTGTSGIVSSTVLAIARGVLKGMLFNQLKLAAIAVFSAVAIGLGAMALAQQTPRERKVDGQPGPVSTTVQQSPRPTVLRLNGTTSLVPEMLHRIQPGFECRIDKVLVELGAVVKKGDPLVECSSDKFAEFKRIYNDAYIRWSSAKKALDHKADPAEASESTPRERFEAKHEEAKSREWMEMANKVLVNHGLNDKEIEHSRSEDAAQRAKLTVRSPADGRVTSRSVVTGDFYESHDTLLVIAQDDPLQVDLSIEPRDADKLEIRQRVTVNLPFGSRPVIREVEAISAAADPKTGKFTVRTSIPNPDHRWKPGLFVRIDVDLGSTAQSTSVNRVSGTRKSNQTLDERLSEVERKLDLLLDAKGGQSPNARVLERLSELERKLDQSLRLHTGK